MTPDKGFSGGAGDPLSPAAAEPNGRIGPKKGMDMTLRSIIFSLAAAAAALIPAAATAAPMLVEAPPSVKVSYADLDIGAPAGRQTLDKRIAGAAKRVCVSDHDLNLPMARETRNCISKAVASANRQVENVLASRTQLAARDLQVRGTH
jgi:UrcA family protein